MLKIYLSPPHLSNREIRYIKSALDANQLSFGDNLDEFQVALESYLSQNVSVAAISSGTAGIHLALILAGVQRNDEVLCQSFTFSASANPILYQGARPIFIDSEQDTWNMCPMLLEKAIQDRLHVGKKPKAIIVVHLYGMPAKMDEIMAISKKYEIALIEDAAEALGSGYKGQKCGTFGDFGILSFNGNKIITSAGGGALVCKNKEEKKQAIFLATQARDEAPHYEHSHIGYNYRMSNVAAGIGRGQMEVLSEHIYLRREINNFYKRLFKHKKGISLLTEPSSDFMSNHWLSCILIDEQETGFSRENLRMALLTENIESRPLWKPMHLQPVFKNFDCYDNGFSEKLFNTGLCLPSGSNITNNDKERIQRVINSFIN